MRKPGVALAVIVIAAQACGGTPPDGSTDGGSAGSGPATSSSTASGGGGGFTDAGSSGGGGAICGPGEQGAPVTVFTTGASIPVALAAAAGSLYLGSGPIGTEDPPTPAFIRLDSCFEGAFLAEGYLDSPYALTAGADAVYFRTTRVPLGGGAIKELSPIYVDVAAVAVDAVALYWLQRDGYGGQGAVGSLWKAPLGGGVPVELAAGQPNPHAVVVAGGYAYWTNSGTRQPGSGAWNQDGALLRIALAGGAPEVLASALARPTGLVGTADRLCFATSEDGAIRTMSFQGGPVTTLLMGGSNPWGLALDGGDLYWTESIPTGAVRRISLAGGSAVTIAASEKSPAGIAVSGAYVYWAVQNGVRRAAK